MSGALVEEGGSNGTRTLAAILRGQQSATPFQVLVQPDPLTVNAVILQHTADTDLNFRFSLLELTRVIELYNTRSGTVRTGAYRPATVASEDGYEPSP